MLLWYPPASGNSNSPIQYLIIDSTENHYEYYSLSLLNNDGTIEAIETIHSHCEYDVLEPFDFSVRIDTDKSLTIHLYLKSDEAIDLQIHGMNGQLLYKQKFKGKEGSNEIVVTSFDCREKIVLIHVFGNSFHAMKKIALSN